MHVGQAEWILLSATKNAARYKLSLAPQCCGVNVEQQTLCPPLKAKESEKPCIVCASISSV